MGLNTHIILVEGTGHEIRFTDLTVYREGLIRVSHSFRVNESVYKIGNKNLLRLLAELIFN